MNDSDDLKATRYLKQIGLAVAALLILYGLVQLFNYFSDVLSISLNYVLLLALQILMAVILIFVGTRVYKLTRNIRLVDIFNRHRPQTMAIMLGFICLIPLLLLPLPASSLFGAAMLYPQHKPISFGYTLGYEWDEQEGALISLTTEEYFPNAGFQVLYDFERVADPNLRGWIIVPYSIYERPGMLYEEVFSPAKARVDLGNISNGDYVLTVVMSGGTDTYYVHKTPQLFSLDAGWLNYGKLESKTDFEKRLDGYTVEYIGYPIIDNSTKQFIANQIRHCGGTNLIFENGSTDGWVVDVKFLFSGDKSSLRYIITQLDMNNIDYFVGISSNTGWSIQTSQYRFTVTLKSVENASLVKDILLSRHLLVFEQSSEGFDGWNNATILKGSSAPLGKTWAELRGDLIQNISNETNLMYETDFYVSY